MSIWTKLFGNKKEVEKPEPEPVEKKLEKLISIQKKWNNACAKYYYTITIGVTEDKKTFVSTDHFFFSETIEVLAVWYKKTLVYYRVNEEPLNWIFSPDLEEKLNGYLKSNPCDDGEIIYDRNTRIISLKGV